MGVEIRMALAPIDRATLGYVAIALAFGVAHGPRQAPAALLMPGALVLAVVVAGVLAPRARAAGPVGRMLAEFYPLLLTVAFYTHVGLVNAAHGVSHDARVIGWEQALFSGQPSLAWIRAFPSLRPLGVVLVPLAVLLSLGTVYGQFHYAVDALAGAAVALCVDWLGRRAGYDSASE
jgi:hypothetical protein